MSRSASDTKLLHYSVNHSDVITQFAETRGKSEQRHSRNDKNNICVLFTRAVSLNRLRHFAVDRELSFCLEKNSSVRKFISCVFHCLNRLLKGEIYQKIDLQKRSSFESKH